jgi:ribose transport system ATP-binding protein
MRVLSGVTVPDEGSLAIGRKARSWNDYGPGEAQAAGIRIVHQELSLCGNLTVAENFFLERPDAGGARPGWRGSYRALARAMARFHLPGPWHRRGCGSGRLPIGQRQMVEIARAASDPNLKLLVLDEPTSSLDPERSRQLRSFIKARAAGGVAFIFISHKLNEILEVTTRVVALRNGRLAWAGSVEGASVERLVEAMGGEAGASLRARRQRHVAGSPARTGSGSHRRRGRCALGSPDRAPLR